MKNLLLTLFLIPYFASFPASFLFGQSSVAITIDDVPNTGKTRTEHYQSKLLKELDAIQIPVTIFVTEGLISSGENPQKNTNLINRWMKSQDEISAWMKKEPADETYKLYDELIAKTQNK